MHEVVYCATDTMEDEMDVEGGLLLISMKEDFEGKRRMSDWSPEEVSELLGNNGFSELCDSHWEPIGGLSVEEVEAKMETLSNDEVTFIKSDEFKRWIEAGCGGGDEPPPA